MSKLKLPIRHACESADTLTPLEGVSACTKKNITYSWETFSTTPKLTLNKRPRIPGWYMLEILVKADSEYLDSSLTVTTKCNKNKKSKDYPL